MKVLNDILNRAQKKKGCIVLPEANVDQRVLSATKIIAQNGLSDLIVFGKVDEFPKEIRDCQRIKIIDLDSFQEIDNMAVALFELRKNKGLTLEGAYELLRQPIYVACMLLYLGYADGLVAGAKYTTSDTLRPALQIIKTEQGKNLVAGSVLLVRETAPETLLFCDASLNENPTAEQLVDISIGGAEFVKNVLGFEPKVAFLSYSTLGSAKSELVEKMQTACKLTKEKYKEYLIDGEMQFDCAVDRTTAERKGITSDVGGNANVMVFPDLNCGNISYKIASRLGGYTAIGPIMVNFRKPVNDLSRGCTIDEIVATVAITKLQIKG